MGIALVQRWHATVAFYLFQHLACTLVACWDSWGRKRVQSVTPWKARTTKQTLQVLSSFGAKHADWIRYQNHTNIIIHRKSQHTAQLFDPHLMTFLTSTRNVRVHCRTGLRPLGLLRPPRCGGCFGTPFWGPMDQKERFSTTGCFAQHSTNKRNIRATRPVYPCRFLWPHMTICEHTTTS